MLNLTNVETLEIHQKQYLADKTCQNHLTAFS